VLPVSRLRDICQNVAGTKQFDLMVLFFIALNCITLAMERPDIPSYSMARLFPLVSSCSFLPCTDTGAGDLVAE